MHKKKIIASLMAVLACANMTTVTVTAENLSTSAKALDFADTDTKSDTGKKKEVNPNISGDYANASLFDDTKVHVINIIISDEEWAKIEAATSDEKKYANCDVEIDGECFKNVAIKAKGHASLNFAKGKRDNTSERVGLRINFDKNDDVTTYHGLNKLSLNNIASDLTCMKDFTAYHMMNDMGVHAPLSSYTVVQKNGEDFALFLAVEDIDESFAVRNYGSDAEIDLYQPESQAASTQSDLEMVLQVFSGRKYADLDKTDRVEPWCDISAKMHPEELKDAACCRWIDDDPDSYQNIWDSDELKCTDEDKAVMMDCLDKLNNGTQKEALSVLDTDQLMRYFAVHGFMNNFDSITGKARYNFYICENNGVLSYVPWDYNESFGGYDTRVLIRDVMGDLIIDMTPTGLNNMMSVEKDLINMPIDNPNRVGGTELLPMLHAWISTEDGKAQYHEICKELTDMEEHYKTLVANTKTIIEPYVQKGLTFYTNEQFQEAMDNMELYMKYRFEAYRKQLDGEMPSTWEGQKAQSDSLIEPEGLELYKMASATNILGVPPAQVVNPIINAFLGEDPDRSSEHFANLMLDYFRDNTTMYDRVPELMQLDQTRSMACGIVAQKYGVDSLFFTDPNAHGGPPSGVGAPSAGGPPADTDGSSNRPDTDI